MLDSCQRFFLVVIAVAYPIVQEGWQRMASPNRQGETSKQLAGLHANSKILQLLDHSR